MFRLLIGGCLVAVIVYLIWLMSETPWGIRLLPPDTIMPDGSRFYGETSNGLWHGNGELLGADGSHYKGEFVKGLFEGQGKLSFRDDGFYIGEFKQGLMHGKGKFESEAAGHYEGDLENDLMHGGGILTFPNGTTYAGEFVENKFSHGEFTDGSGNTYTGGMKDWLFHGEGVYVSAEGDRYEGSFKEGSLEGEGVAVLADGGRYEGNFSSWLYSGEGILRNADGDIYEGSFEHGNYHGKGKLTLAEPTEEVSVLEGNWNHGYLEDDPRYKRPDYSEQIESLLYSQERILGAALKDVEDSRRGDIDVFFLGVAGYGAQDVFLKEMNTIERRLAAEKIAQGRTLTLVNHFDTIADKPLATLTSLSMTLGDFAEKMNVKEDILLLYMTSHGSKDHHFAIQLDDITLPDITPDSLAKALDQSGIRHKVIILSACYSGGFIHDLEGPTTLVMTAAKDDRKSFGCGDDSEMTYFGHAFFEQALPEAKGFVDAFERAKLLVAERESNEFPGKPHSEPQISVGEGIREQLLAWKKQRDLQLNQ